MSIISNVREIMTLKGRAGLKACLAVVALSMTVGCGFSPVYSTQGSGIGPVTIGPIDGRGGYFLRHELDRYAALERASTPPQALDVKLTTTFESAAFGVDGLSSRTRLTMTAAYTLAATPPATPKTGVVTTTLGYESLDQAYGDVALQADAEERAAKQLADRLWADLRRQTQSAR